MAREVVKLTSWNITKFQEPAWRPVGFVGGMKILEPNDLDRENPAYMSGHVVRQKRREKAIRRSRWRKVPV